MSQLTEALGERLSPSSKMDASSERGGETFGLPFTDVLALAVCYERV